MLLKIKKFIKSLICTKYIPYLTRYQYAKKIRVGRPNDGGYVLADGLDYDLLLTCGIANDVSFETDFLKTHTSLTGHAFDGTVSGLPEGAPAQLNFHQKNISGENTDKTTNLLEFMKGHQDIFLKMDIEGGEYEWLPQVSTEDLKKIKQIALEWHNTDMFHMKFSEQLKRWECLKKLCETHYLIHLHPNNYMPCDEVFGTVLPTALELTFLRKSEFQEKPPVDLQAIPTPLDQTNATDRPDIVLTGFPYTSNR